MSKHKKVISLGLGNYYGSVEAYETEKGGFFISLGCYSGTDIQRISEEFFRAIEKEFGGD